MTWRTGMMPHRNPQRAREKSDGVGTEVRVYGYVDGDIGDGLPGAEQVEDNDASGEADGATGERDQYGFREEFARE